MNISVAMVAMVNHTAVAALHSESIHGGDEHEIGESLQVQDRGGGGNASLQERHLAGDGSWSKPKEDGDKNVTDGQVDGPFVWETTVRWNNFVQQWSTIHMCF